ncbi:hypothetical protein OF83DRAFT_1087374, partial [Amylostereum chailletii]
STSKLVSCSMVNTTSHVPGCPQESSRWLLSGMGKPEKTCTTSTGQMTCIADSGIFPATDKSYREKRGFAFDVVQHRSDAEKASASKHTDVGGAYQPNFLSQVLTFPPPRATTSQGSRSGSIIQYSSLYALLLRLRSTYIHTIRVEERWTSGATFENTPQRPDPRLNCRELPTFSFQIHLDAYTHDFFAPPRLPLGLIRPMCPASPVFEKPPGSFSTKPTSKARTNIPKTKDSASIHP